MKRIYLLLVVLFSGALLGACQGAGPEAAATPAAQDAGDTRLILGTLQLRESDLAVDAAQAAELLPLWKAYRALSQSDAASDAELAALLDQIREVMRPEQLTAIDALAMGPADQAALAAEMGLEMPSRPVGDITEEEIATRMAERGIDPAAFAAGGGFPGGGLPGGAMIPPEGDSRGAFAQGAQQASAGGGAAVRAGVVGRANMLLEALITYLEGLA